MIQRGLELKGLPEAQAQKCVATVVVTKKTQVLNCKSARKPILEVNFQVGVKSGKDLITSSLSQREVEQQTLAIGGDDLGETPQVSNVDLLIESTERKVKGALKKVIDVKLPKINCLSRGTKSKPTRRKSRMLQRLTKRCLGQIPRRLKGRKMLPASKKMFKEGKSSALSVQMLTMSLQVPRLWPSASKRGKASETVEKISAFPVQDLWAGKVNKPEIQRKKDLSREQAAKLLGSSVV